MLAAAMLIAGGLPAHAAGSDFTNGGTGSLVLLGFFVLLLVQFQRRIPVLENGERLGDLAGTRLGS